MRARRQRLREVVGLGVPIVLLLAIEAVALRSSHRGFLLIGVVAGVAILAVVISFNMRAVAVFLTCAAAVTLTWNGWFFGGLRPGDIFAILAVVVFFFTAGHNQIPRLPWWIWQLAAAILLVAAINIVWQPSPGYVASRVLVAQKGNTPVSQLASITSANIQVGLKFIVGVVFIPLAFGFATYLNRRNAKRLIVLFGFGSAVSGWTAILALYGLNTLNRLTHLLAPPGVARQVGLSDQPNYLAAGAVISVPIGMWLVFEQDRRSKLMGWFILGGTVLGVYASGSRGGAVCVVFSLVVSLILVPRARRVVVPTFLAALTLAVGVYVIVPSFGRKILRVTRLVGAGQITGPSDQARSTLANQAWADFHHSPLHGIGLQVSFDAQTVYLQALQSGGILLLFPLLVYYLSAAGASFQMMRVEPAAAALCASVLSALALDVFEADLTDRFYYVPIAAIVALKIAMQPEPEPPPVPIARTPATTRRARPVVGART